MRPRRSRDAPSCGARPHRLVGDKVDLYLGLRCDDGADVPPLDHDVPLLAERALPLAHHLPHLVVARDDRDELVDVGLADRGRHIAPSMNTRPASSKPDRVLGRELGELVGEVERQPGAARAR